MEVKRFVIDVKYVEQKDAWEVVAYCADNGRELLSAPHIMRRLSHPNKAALVFPVPPEKEVQDMDNTLPHCSLCAATNVETIQAVYNRIADRRLEDRDALIFGRYLFSTLLGDTLWDRMIKEVGTESIELALRWPAEEWALSRLPWEMMSNDAKTFLAADPHRLIAMTRIVATPEQAQSLKPLQLHLPLKVLFVVGTALNDERIRPGAEYLNLLQRLKASGQYLALNPYVLQRATSEAIGEAIERFQPTVIHFICHGNLVGNKGYLELVSADRSGKDELDGTRLHTMLTRSGKQQPPQIIVLNACKSGATAAQEGMSLAVELVSRGVPMVAAMNGEIADHACRLFTRRFYEALLSGKSVACATAEGRWAGIAHMRQPERKIDWAYPTLFLADGISPAIKLQQNADWLEFQKIAEGFHILNNPPIFCDRLDVIEKYYRELMTPCVDNAVVKRVVDNAAVKRILAVEVDVRAIPMKHAQYGKTRLLEELAAKAVRDGHVPCLLSYQEGEELPRNLLELGMAFVKAIDSTRKRFKLDTTPQNDFLIPDHELLKLIETILPALVVVAAGLNPRLQYGQRIKKIYSMLKTLTAEQRNEIDNGLARDALQVDLKKLADEVQQKYPELPLLTVLVLIDEVHLFDSAAAEFIKWLGPHGLGTEEKPVPVIFTFSSNQQEEQAQYSGALKALTDFLEQKRSYTEVLTLGPLCQTVDDLLPYQQYLLHYKVPLVINRAAEKEKIKLFFQRLHGKVKGIPSRLKIGEENDDVEALIESWTDNNVLEEANDEQIMELKQPGGV